MYRTNGSMVDSWWNPDVNVQKAHLHSVRCDAPDESADMVLIKVYVFTALVEIRIAR